MPVARRLFFLILVGSMIFGPPGAVRAVSEVPPGNAALPATGSTADLFGCVDESPSSAVCLGQCGSTSACAVMMGQQALPIPLAGSADPVSFYLIPSGSLSPPESQPPRALLNV